MEIDEIVADLLEVPLSEFTGRRNARAKELKGEGRGELATRVSALKKPPSALWAANQLARRDRPALNRLRRAGEAVVRAQSAALGGQQHGAGELRQASEALSRELEAAVGIAAGALRTDDHAADEAALRRIREILRLGAVSEGPTWSQLERGTLIAEPRAGEDMLTEVFAMDPGVAAPPPTSGRAADAKVARAAEANAARAAALKAREAQLRLDKEHAERTARLDAEHAQAAAETARRLREQADDMAADARKATGRARQAEREAEQARVQAKRSQDAARRRRAHS